MQTKKKENQGAEASEETNLQRIKTYSKKHFSSYWVRLSHSI